MVISVSSSWISIFKHLYHEFLCILIQPNNQGKIILIDYFIVINRMARQTRVICLVLKAYFTTNFISIRVIFTIQLVLIV